MNPQEMAKARRALDIQQTAKKFLTSQAEHHTAMAKAHNTSAADFDEDSSEHIFHKAAAQSHLAAGEAAAECCQCCKADTFTDLFKSDLSDGDELIPTKVSAIIPDAQPTPGGRLVYRTGMHEVKQPTHGNTPFNFEKLTAIEE
jgi:hypothetical protein